MAAAQEIFTDKVSPGDGNDILGRLQREYETRLGMLLRVSPPIQCAFHLSLTRNLCLNKVGEDEYTARLREMATAEEVLEGLAALIVDHVDAGLFLAEFSLSRLLRKWQSGHRHFDYVCRRLTESGRIIWVRIIFRLVCSPLRGDVEVVVCTEDYERKHTEEVILRNITAGDYQAIGTIEVATGEASFYIRQPGDPTEDARSGHFDENTRLLISQIDSEAERRLLERDCNISSLVTALKAVPAVSFTFRMQGRYQQLTYRYLDEVREKLLFTRRDVTDEVREREKNEQLVRSALAEAERAGRMKALFMSNVSHDLRTPLNAILGYNELALREEGLPRKVRDYLEKGQQAGQTMLLLVNDTLDLQRIETGGGKPRLLPVWPDNFVARLINTVEPQLRAKELHFTYDGGNLTGLCVLMDPTPMRQVFLNLISNAVKYTPRGGSIWLRVQEISRTAKDMEVEFTVEDTGIGMSEKFAREQLFEPFAQERLPEAVSALGEGNPGGSGLGLSIVQRAVEMLGGSVRVRSRLGEGTAFTVRLRLAFAGRTPGGPPKAPAREEASPGQDLSGVRILLCEDNEMNAEIAREVLQQVGARVDLAADGQEGLEKYGREPPHTYDIVLLDIRMPRLNGFETAKAIRSLGREDAALVPILAVSADAYDSDRQKAGAAGMNGYLSKPLDTEAAIKEIRRLVQERK